MSVSQISRCLGDRCLLESAQSSSTIWSLRFSRSGLSSPGTRLTVRPR